MTNKSEMRYIRPYLKLYNKMQKKIDKSYKKYEHDLKEHKSNRILAKDQQELFLLLGELNYLTIECKKLAQRRAS
jgi:hypothetical protein